MIALARTLGRFHIAQQRIHLGQREAAVGAYRGVAGQRGQQFVARFLEPATGAVFAQVLKLMKHPKFTLKNPNRARSLLSTLCTQNPAAFHRLDAAGYVLWADKLLELDALNPQVAGRLARALDRWAALAEPYRSAAREAIARVAAKSDLSNDVREVVTRALD